MTGFAVFRPEDRRFATPTWRPEEPLRTAAELSEAAGLEHSRANVWRYPPGAAVGRHAHDGEEEVFVVLEGRVTAYLGEPPERHELTAGAVAVAHAGTAVQLVNETDAEAVFFAYSAPAEHPSTGRWSALPDAR